MPLGGHVCCAEPGSTFLHAFLSSLPPAQRIVALLINLGLDRAEISHLLGLSDAAFCQRLSGLRKVFQTCAGEVEFFEGLSFVLGGWPRTAFLEAIPLTSRGAHFRHS